MTQRQRKSKRSNQIHGRTVTLADPFGVFYNAVGWGIDSGRGNNLYGTDIEIF